MKERDFDMTVTYLCEESLKTLNVSNYELAKADIEEAVEFYNNELKWDSLINYRSVQIQFENTSRTSVEEKKLQIRWYQKLILSEPTYLYFLSPKCFAEALLSVSIPSNAKYFVETLQKVPFNQEIITYICESIEDLHSLNLAPISLVEEILNHIEQLIN